uniref:Choline transporter-like protein n=1 Tax=Anoplophora glabripennis TaxID=217634 RepID=V5GSQ9_ANOGL
MGASASRSLQPEQLAMFKKLPPSNNFYQAEIEIPEREENRVPTDKKFLIVLGVMILVLLPFVIYTLCYSDMDRLSIYDQCGNICGKKNAKYDQWECTGQDYTNKKLLQFDNLHDVKDIYLSSRRCVSECYPGYSEMLQGYCFEGEIDRTEATADVDLENWSSELGVFLQSMAWRLTLACFLSLGVALSMLYLFRVAAAAMVWSILAGVLVLLVILVAFLWYGYFKIESNDKGGLIIAPLFFTIMLVILVAVLVFLYKKIALVIVIFKEAMKATFAMPRLLLVPIVTFFADLLVVVIFLIALAFMLSAGTLTEIIDGYLQYQPNVVMQFSIIFSFWMTFWVSQFLTGIQYMVIAGAVSKWYFAKDKNNLNAPIITSASIAFKFHLGTAAFGSLIITVMAIIRSLISSLFKNKFVKACFDSCMSVIEDFLKYLSKNAYIMTAMHGKPFFKSGKRAARILLQNVANIVVLNYIGDFVIVMAQVLVMLISLLFTYLILQGVDSPHKWAVYVIVGIISIIVAAICFSIFETVIDTIYLCFCEDKLLNDGMARPYAMSRDLMEFMEDSKKIFGEKKT